MYPVRLEVDSILGTSIKDVKESLRQIPNKGIGYGVIIGYDSVPLPKVSFNYLGQFDQNTKQANDCLLYTSPSPRDRTRSRMPSSA